MYLLKSVTIKLIEEHGIGLLGTNKIQSTRFTLLVTWVREKELTDMIGRLIEQNDGWVHEHSSCQSNSHTPTTREVPTFLAGSMAATH